MGLGPLEWTPPRFFERGGAKIEESKAPSGERRRSVVELQAPRG